MRFRIFHVTDSLRQGGLENGLVNLISGMDPNRFEHVVCTLRGLGPNAERLRGRAQIVSLQNSGNTQAWAIGREIRRVRPHIVHSRNWGAIEAVFAARMFSSCATVHSEHGIDVDTADSEPRRRRFLRRLAYGLATRVVSVSHQLRDFHCARTGFAPDRFTVVHNGVDSSRFQPDAAAREAVRAELAIPPEDFCIGCVGNLLAVKDHGTAISALARTGRPWRLIVAGQGPELPRLQALAQSHPGLADRVLFLGLRHDIPRLLNALDAYVLPSLTEGICNSLLEAMATGLPVIATATGGNLEVITDESGLLFPVGNASCLAAHLASLATRSELRQALAGQARKRVCEHFSMKSMIENYEALYDGLLPLPRRRLQPVAGV